MSDTSLEMELMQLAFGDAEGASPELIKRLGKTFQAGDLLFKEGDHSSELFILLKGEVEVFTGGSSNENRLAVLPSGQILGEMSHFDRQPRSASCRALREVHALVFDTANFALIFQLHPKWTIQLVEGLAERCCVTLDGLSRL